MSVVLDWREDDDAPTPGATVGPAARFAEDGVYFVDIGDFAMIVVRRGGALSAFWNLCPHQFLPLNWRGDSVLSADGALIRCSNPDAAFHAGDGTPAGGGSIVACGLSKISVRVEGGNLVIAPS